MSTYTLVVKGSEWLTSNQRRNRYEHAKITAEWRENATAAAMNAQVYQRFPRGLERVHITAWLIFGDHRRRDPNNWEPTVKPCVDGIVDAGLILDDSHKHVVGPDIRWDLNQRSRIPTVVLQIETLGETP